MSVPCWICACGLFETLLTYHRVRVGEAVEDQEQVELRRNAIVAQQRQNAFVRGLSDLQSSNETLAHMIMRVTAGHVRF